MGPQPFGCGRMPYRQSSRILPLASMGPQPFGCGRKAPTRWQRYTGQASMGPQPFGCGRKVNGPEPARHTVASMGPQPFGCGRGTARPIRRRRPSCFNGAATFRLRKVRSEDALQKTIHALQWGRNLSVAEGAIARNAMGNPAGFNGAATFRLRKDAPAGVFQVWTQGFNGAATFRLRKVGLVDGTLRASQASMGPQPFGCGRGDIEARQGWCPPASMGPQPFGCGRGGNALGVPGGAPVASMGPQPFGCGRGAAALSGTARARRFNGAATFRLRKDRLIGRALAWQRQLQWGRNLSVAEGTGAPADQ